MALLSKKTATRISNAINGIRVADMMLSPDAVFFSKNPSDAEKLDYRNRWRAARDADRMTLLELGIAVA